MACFDDDRRESGENRATEGLVTRSKVLWYGPIGRRAAVSFRIEGFIPSEKMPLHEGSQEAAGVTHIKRIKCLKVISG